jgi:DNA-binding FrmR family transcriptional regulator
MLMVRGVRKDVLDRLSRIEGHIRGIMKIVKEDRDCTELLLQITVVRAATDAAGKSLLEDRLESCFVEAVKSREYEEHI